MMGAQRLFPAQYLVLGGGSQAETLTCKKAQLLLSLREKRVSCFFVFPSNHLEIGYWGVLQFKKVLNHAHSELPGGAQASHLLTQFLI